LKFLRLSYLEKIGGTGQMERQTNRRTGRRQLNAPPPPQGEPLNKQHAITPIGRRDIRYIDSFAGGSPQLRCYGSWSYFKYPKNDKRPTSISNVFPNWKCRFCLIWQTRYVTRL